MIVFHRIGVPNRETFTNSLEQILDCKEISFDGVYTSVFDNRANLPPSILFISGDQIGRKGFCNKEQLLELKKLGHTLAWHGWSHRRLPELTDDEKRLELRRPDWIEPIYAYPHGDFDERCKQVIKAYGYIRAYSTTQGDDDNFSLRREYL